MEHNKPQIHATAQVHPDASLAADVEVGPFSIIGPHVTIGAGTRIAGHAVINGHTTIGRDNLFYQFVSIGEKPQHRGYAGEPTRVEIGDGNEFREFCTVHRGTTFDQSLTAIGDHNLLMAYSHVAHDCVLGDHITMANGASLAGHVRIGDGCLFGGFAMVHQFVRVGPYAFLGYATGVSKDVLPYSRCADHTAKPYGINIVGMRRAGFSKDAITIAKHLYKLVYRSGLLLDEAIERLTQEAQAYPMAGEYAQFLQASERGIIR